MFVRVVLRGCFLFVASVRLGYNHGFKTSCGSRSSVRTVLLTKYDTAYMISRCDSSNRTVVKGGNFRLRIRISL